MWGFRHPPPGRNPDFMGLANSTSFLPPWRKVLILCLWQLVSMMLTATGYCSQRLATDFGIDAPTAQSSANYALLSLHGIPLALRRRRRRARTGGVSEGETAEATAAGARLRPWQWLLLAAADVEANYLLVLAYQYTDITSVSLLDAFTVPAVMVFSRLLFRTRYSPRQLLAVGICLGGLVVLVVSDALLRPRNELPPSPPPPPEPLASASTLLATALAPSLPPAPPPPERSALGAAVLLGDGLVLMGAVLYAASNVWQEHQVRATDGTEYLANLGFYGALVSGVQCAMLERPALRHAADAVHTASSVGRAGELLALEAGFIAALCSMYMLATRLMGAGSSATVMNLSLLTSDFWSVVVGVLLLGSQLSGWYALAFALVVGGLVVYHAKPRSEFCGPLREPLNTGTPSSTAQSYGADDHEVQVEAST